MRIVAKDSGRAGAEFAFLGPIAPLCAYREPKGLKSAMPRIVSRHERSIAFLYRTREEAEERRELGGTGFIVGRSLAKSDDLYGAPHCAGYLVSNRHVVHDGGACVASVAKSSGDGNEILDIDQNDWIAHPDGDDIAIASLSGYATGTMSRHLIHENEFLTRETLRELDVGNGDDIYMIGRFVGLDGKTTNQPAVRQGSISISNASIYVNREKRYQEGYAVEMRSRGGFSGSPVFVYRTEMGKMPGRVAPETANKVSAKGTSFAFFQSDLNALLGVNWGYILNENGDNTFMNGVVPAWKISELLDVPELKKHHDKLEAEIREELGKGGAVQSIANEEESEMTEGDAVLNRMLNTSPAPKGRA